MRIPIIVCRTLLLLVLFSPTIAAADDQVVISSDVRAQATTGGNDAGGETVVTGDARASASVETTVNDELLESVNRSITSPDGDASVDVSVHTDVQGGEVTTETVINSNGNVETFEHSSNLPASLAGGNANAGESEHALDEASQDAPQSHPVARLWQRIVDGIASWWANLFAFLRR